VFVLVEVNTNIL